jgi:hypothetical protein
MEVAKESVPEKDLGGPYRVHGPLKRLLSSSKWQNRYYELNNRYLKMYEVGGTFAFFVHLFAHASL